MSNFEHVLHKRTTISQPPQATRHQEGCIPIVHIVPVAQTSDELITESICGPARRAATAGDPKANLINKVPSRAMDYSAIPLVIQRSAMLEHLTHNEGEAPFFKNLDDEQEYLWRKNARLENQHEIECLRARVLGQNTYQHSELLEALAKPQAPQQPTPIELPTKRSTVLPLDYGGHK